MFAVVGTVPDDDFPVVRGAVSVDGDMLRVEGSGRIHEIPINRGTAALLAAAFMVCRYFGKPSPEAFLVEEPSTEALEAIGGTGDIITGLLAGFTGIGWSITRACIASARISRAAGHASNPDPGTQVADIIRHIPEALDKEALDRLR